MADPCVVGLDVGGSHSRAVLATLDGRTVGTGRAGGGNPTVTGAGAAIANIVTALKAALGDVPGDRVEACVVGLAGVSTLMADPQAARVLEQAWSDAGLSCPVQVVSDVTVSFAAGTPAPDGTMLVSGTGAVAARMHDRLPARFRDGYGWLLGDEGSGFWIGRQAARAAIAAADGRQPMAELATSVLAQLLDQHSEPLGRAGRGGGSSEVRSGAAPRVNSGTDSPNATSNSTANTADRPADTLASNPTTDPANSPTGTPASSPTGDPATAPATNPATVPATTRDLHGSTTPRRSSSPDSPGPASNPAPATATSTTTQTAAHPSTPVPPTATATLPLASTIGEGFTLGGRRRAAELVRAVAAQPTVALAGLAPLVMAAYELGDPAAARIVAAAADALVDSLAGVAPAAGEPVVLGGSVLVSRSPVFQAVATAIGGRWPDSPVALAADGAAGATWLAARRLVGAERAAAGHAAFTGAHQRSAEFS